MQWLVISSETVNGEEKRISIELEVVFSFDKGLESWVVCMLVTEAKLCPLNNTSLTPSLPHPYSTVMEETEKNNITECVKKYQLHKNLKYTLDKEALVWWEFGLWSYKELNLNRHLVALKHFFYSMDQAEHSM